MSRPFPVLRAAILTMSLAGSSFAAPPFRLPEGAASGPATAVLRVVQREAWPPEGEPTARFMVEVLDVLSGWLPASVVLAEVDASSPAIGLFRDDARIHAVLVELPDGTYRVRNARPAPQEPAEHDPFPPPLLNPPGEPPSRELRARALTGNPAFIQEVVELVNQARWEYGDPDPELPPLKQNDLLHTAAQGHSENMAYDDFWGHCDTSGALPDDRVIAAGYAEDRTTENIAVGHSSPYDVMYLPVYGLMNSTGHRANILDPNVREIGVGYEYQSNDQANVEQIDNSCTTVGTGQGPYLRYWTQVFGRRDSVYPVVINREAAETTSIDVDLYVYGTGWATSMRFSNDGSTWSSWESFVADKAWALSSGNGTKTVYAEITNGSTTYQNTDTIVLNATCPYPDTIDLENETVTTTEEYTACTRISAGTNYAIESPGDLTLHAPTVVLCNGFSLDSGAALTAGT